MDLKFESIKKGQRCLFYDRENDKTFRADFLDILSSYHSHNRHYMTLRVTKYEKDGYQPEGMVTMPLFWISKVETLDDITLNKMIIPSEICLEIDSFM
jgi:hypothetical protein